MNGSVALDVVLVSLLALYAWSGWRQGLVAALLGLVGLVGGAYLAMRLAPALLEEHTDVVPGSALGVLALVGAVLACALLGQALLLLLARRLRGAASVPALRVVDSALGLVAVLVTAVLVVWVLAGAVGSSGPAAVRRLVSGSAVVSAIDGVVPQAADGLVDELASALDAGVFPQVFEGFGPEPIVPVAAPDAGVATDPDVQRALASVVHVRAESDRCGRAQIGSGWVSGTGSVVTNAHVVAGAEHVTVSVRGTGPERAALVVAFDPRRDVAVLEVPDLGAPRLEQGAALSAGGHAALVGFPGDNGLWIGAARVRDVLRARGADIHGVLGVPRHVYSLRAKVRRGASGGPVLDRDGDVVGMVFATSLDDPHTGYALTLDEVAPVLRRAARSSHAVATGECASG